MSDKKPAHRPPKAPVIEKEINGNIHQTTERMAVKNGNSAAVGVPLDWLGKRCLVVLLDD